MAQTVKIRLDGPGGLPMSEKVLTWWAFIEPSLNPREMYFRLLALKDRIIQQS